MRAIVTFDQKMRQLEQLQSQQRVLINLRCAAAQQGNNRQVRITIADINLRLKNIERELSKLPSDAVLL